MGENLRIVISNSIHNFLQKLIGFLPNLLALITIFIVGFLLAWIVKMILSSFLKAVHFDRASERWGLTQMLSQGGVTHAPSQLVSRFVYWIIVLITLILGVNALEVAPTQKFIGQFFIYLPNLFAAILILFIGYLIAHFLSRAALIAAVNAHIAEATLLGRAVRWLIIILVLSMALYHLGIAEKIVVAAFSIFFGGIVLALAIAFGWGGRELAKNFLEGLSRKREAKKEKSDELSHL